MSKISLFLAVLAILMSSSCISLALTNEEKTSTAVNLDDLQVTYYLYTEDWKLVETTDLNLLKGRFRPYAIEDGVGPIIMVALNRPSPDYVLVEWDGPQKKVLSNREGVEAVNDHYYLKLNYQTYLFPGTTFAKDLRNNDFFFSKGKSLFNGLPESAELVRPRTYEVENSLAPTITFKEAIEKVEGTRNVIYFLSAEQAGWYIYLGGPKPAFKIATPNNIPIWYGWTSSTVYSHLQGKCFTIQYNYLFNSSSKIDPLEDNYPTKKECQ